MTSTNQTNDSNRKMTSTRGIDYWTRNGMFSKNSEVCLTKQSWRRCDKLNGLRGDDRVQQRTSVNDIYSRIRYYQKNFCHMTSLTKEDGAAIEILQDSPSKPTRGIDYWTGKRMFYEAPVILTKQSWRRCDKLNGLRGDDRLDVKMYKSGISSNGSYTYDRYYAKVLVPNLRIKHSEVIEVLY